MAERILVVEEGRIVEAGSHDDLIAMNGRYAYLFTRQAFAGYFAHLRAGRAAASASTSR